MDWMHQLQRLHEKCLRTVLFRQESHNSKPKKPHHLPSAMFIYTVFVYFSFMLHVITLIQELAIVAAAMWLCVFPAFRGCLNQYDPGPLSSFEVKKPNDRLQHVPEKAKGRAKFCKSLRRKVRRCYRKIIAVPGKIHDAGRDVYLNHRYRTIDDLLDFDEDDSLSEKGKWRRFFLRRQKA